LESGQPPKERTRARGKKKICTFTIRLKMLHIGGEGLGAKDKKNAARMMHVSYQL
jgi:hypothetical protein